MTRGTLVVLLGAAATGTQRLPHPKPRLEASPTSRYEHTTNAERGTPAPERYTNQTQHFVWTGAEQNTNAAATFDRPFTLIVYTTALYRGCQKGLYSS